MDRIVIDSLEVNARIGVPDEEQAKPQRLTISFGFEPEIAFDALRDDIRRTADYTEICKAVQEIAERAPRRLMETLADDIAGELLRRFPLRSVEVEVRKYVLPGATFAAAKAQRSASQISRTNSGPR
jgi:7,8-dihydroneopterin aldolase/epimerase/oxygenase